MEEYEYESICIFTESGRTYTFLNIDLICNNESVIVFNYIAQSDDDTKVATFYKNRIVGISLMKQGA